MKDCTLKIVKKVGILKKKKALIEKRLYLELGMSPILSFNDY